MKCMTLWLFQNCKFESILKKKLKGFILADFVWIIYSDYWEMRISSLWPERHLMMETYMVSSINFRLYFRRDQKYIKCKFVLHSNVKLKKGKSGRNMWNRNRNMWTKRTRFAFTFQTPFIKTLQYILGLRLLMTKEANSHKIVLRYWSKHDIISKNRINSTSHQWAKIS